MADFCYIQRTDEAAQTAPPALTTQPLEAVVMADESLNPSVEIWKPVVGYPEYEVSSHGRVRSVARRKGARTAVNGGLLAIRPLYLRREKKLARLYVQLKTRGQKRKRPAVHRLVLEAFVGPCPPRMIGCHYDGDPSNNRLENLRWDTHKGNSQDMIRHGRSRKGFAATWGEAHPIAKLTEEAVREIRATPVTYGGDLVLARRFGVTKGTIAKARRRENWKHI